MKRLNRALGFTWMTVLPAVGLGEPPPGHGVHPPMPSQAYSVQFRLDTKGEPSVTEVPLELPSPTDAAELNQPVALPAPAPRVRLKRYLPQARLEQKVTEAESGPGESAVQLAIVGPTQSLERWLVAGDMERNRVVSFIGTWRYMTVENAAQRDILFRQFQEELTREPKVIVGRASGGAVRELPGRAGEAHELEDLGCTIRVREFYPHFAFDEKTKQPINRSDQRLNPAVQVELTAEGRREERWVFGKFPDFKMGAGESLPFRIALDCPVEVPNTTPDFVVVTVGQAAHEAWTRYRGAVRAQALLLDQKIKVEPSQYTFHLAQFVPRGVLVETYVPAEGPGGTPALQLETLEESGPSRALWLGLNQQRIIPTPGGPMVVTFAARERVSPETQPGGAHP